MPTVGATNKITSSRDQFFRCNSALLTQRVTRKATNARKQTFVHVLALAHGCLRPDYACRFDVTGMPVAVAGQDA